MYMIMWQDIFMGHVVICNILLQCLLKRYKMNSCFFFYIPKFIKHIFPESAKIQSCAPHSKFFSYMFSTCLIR